MIIKQLSIGNFGKLKDKKIELKDGINIVYGKNEQGKTTVHQFIESFFAASRDGFNDSYDKYRPWNESEAFYGDMELEVNNESVVLSCDFNEETIEKSIDESSELEKRLKELTVMNLLGVREINTVNSKDFINEIQHRIVNIKNVSGIALDYENSVKGLHNKKELLINDQLRTKNIEELRSLKNSVKELKASILNSKADLIEYYDLKKLLADELNQKEVLEDSIKLREYKDTVRLVEQIEQLMAEIDAKTEEINKDWLYSEHDFEEVEYLIDSIHGNMEKESAVEEIALKKNILEDELSGMEMLQSETAIRFLTDNLYGEDFIYDVKNYERAVEELKFLESDAKVEEYKQAKLEEEKDKKNLNDLEHDYVNMLNLRNKRSSVVELTKDKDEFIANKTKLGLLQERAKPLNGFLFMVVALLAVAIVLIVLVPSVFSMALVFAIVLFVLVLVIAYMGYNNRRETDQLVFIVNKLQADQDELLGRLKGIDLELDGITGKYDVKSSLEFEHYYLNRKNELLQKDKVDYSDIEVKVNDLTFNKNMLKRRVDKWLHDSELNKSVSSSEEELETKVKKHIADCDEYVHKQEMIKAFDEEILALNNEINEMYEVLKTDEKYCELLEVELDEILEAKENYLKLKEEKEALVDSKAKLLGQLTYDELIDKRLGEKELVETVDEERCIFETVELLKAQLAEMVSLIVDNQQNLDATYKKLASVTKSKVVLKQQLAKISDLKSEEGKVQERLKVLEKAMDNLNLSADEIKGTYDKELTKSIGKILAKLTGSYDEVVIDGDMNFFVKDNVSNKLVALEELSRGVLDQLYFAVRIGLMDTVNENLETPLVLDDCFVHYDDERLENVLKVLSNLKRQVIIFTCQRREQYIMEEANMEHNRIAFA